MKLLLRALCFFIVIQYSTAQVYMDTSLSTEELVTNVLIGNPNFPSSNYEVITGTQFGSVNGVAAFQTDEVYMPFEEGLVLSTGDVMSISGANTSIISAGNTNWLGDVDLETITGDSYTLNASYISFDFIADVDAISLDFMMASEEYGVFECAFADRFAFIITDLNTGISENIALVPETTTPISVVTVRGGGNTTCMPDNEAYFERYNYVPDNTSASHILPEDAPINFNGQTKVFVLMKDLVVGNPYHIKIVVADSGDSIYDSAIFVRNSSFGAFPTMAQMPSDLVVEDTDDNGTEMFNLRMNETQMLGGINTAVYSFDFSYHSTLGDAESGVNAIANPEAYQNTNPLETIYVRMANSYTGTAITNEFKVAINADLLSTNEFDITETKLYPNPVVNQLYIESVDHQIKVIEVYNMIGQRMFSESYNNLNNTSIDVSQYESGQYFIKLATEQGSVIKHFLKQ
jgi:hypothetical protein